MKRKKIPVGPPLTKIAIETLHPSGIGSVPHLRREEEIPLELAKELFNRHLIEFDVTNGCYCCWSDKWNNNWKTPTKIKL